MYKKAKCFLESKPQILIDNVIAEWIFQVTSYAIKTNVKNKTGRPKRNMCIRKIKRIGCVTCIDYWQTVTPISSDQWCFFFSFSIMWRKMTILHTHTHRHTHMHTKLYGEYMCDVGTNIRRISNILALVTLLLYYIFFGRWSIDFFYLVRFWIAFPFCTAIGHFLRLFFFLSLYFVASKIFIAFLFLRIEVKCSQPFKRFGIFFLCRSYSMVVLWIDFHLKSRKKIVDILI